MNKILTLLALLSALLLAFCQCSESGSTAPNHRSAGTETLLGLGQDHANLYQQFDTLISFVPNYHITLDTNLVTYAVSEVDSASAKYDLFISTEKLARLIITSNSVAMTGYYQKIDGHDSLFHFIDPPEILPVRIAVNQIWQFYVPPLHRQGQELTTSFLNFGFGYEVTRTYLGKEEIVVPAGAYNAHKIRSDYRLPGTDEIVKTDIEYLVEKIGLVRMYSSGHFGSSHILLIETN